MQPIVLDTNCLLQILPSKSIYHAVWKLILDGKICLCVNTEILEEYEEIISMKTSPQIAHNIVEAIARLSTTRFQTSYVHFRLIEQDLDDNKFVDCAIAANADYIVSNDNHFSILNDIEWPKITVLRLDKYFLNKDFQHLLQD